MFIAHELRGQNQVPFVGLRKGCAVDTAAVEAAADADPRATLLILMAQQLHLAGTTTDRLEAMLTRMADVLGLELHALSTPTSITLAIGPAYYQKVVLLRLSPGSLDLNNVATLTEVYDAVCARQIDIAQAVSRVRRIIEQTKPAPGWRTIGSFALVSIGTAMLLGADPREVLVAALIGCSTGAIAAIAGHSATVARLFEVLAAFFGTLIVAGFNHFVGPTDLYISIIAGIVPLLPGYSLASALYELANGDLVAGMARLGRVIAVVLELACGAALAIAIAGTAILGPSVNSSHSVGMLTWTLAITLMTIGLSSVLRARLRDYVWIFAACFIALLSTRLLVQLPGHQVATFGAAFISGMVANLGARFLRVPQAVLLVPAVFVLVPGSLTYESVFYLFQQDFGNAAGLGVNAVIASIFIVAGLLLSQLLMTHGAQPLRVIRQLGGR